MFKEKIGEAAMYEGLAEEAVELAHAALKVARILRGENPTPVKLEDARNMVVEEYSDLGLVACELDIQLNEQIMLWKGERWFRRLMEEERIRSMKDAGYTTDNIFGLNF